VTAEGGPFAGMDRFAARKAVKGAGALAQKGLERGSKKHTHAVGHCQRCDTHRGAVDTAPSGS
jgi:valyl-tRNA synthetase